MVRRAAHLTPAPAVRPDWHTAPEPAVLAWVCASVGAGWRVVRTRRMAGGIAMATDAVELGAPDGRSRRLVLRRWLRPGWEEEDPDFTAAREAVVLDRLAGSGLPVPRVIAVDPDGRATGSPAILMTHLDGHRASPVTEDRPAVIAGMAEALVRIHALDAGLESVVEPFAPFTLLERWRPPAGSDRHRLWARARALCSRAPEPGRATFLHRDYHPGNTLWSGRRLAGIVDWTGASWGPPAVDLAHWRANLGTRHGLAVADRATAAYRAVGGDAEAQPWWDVRLLLDYVPDLDLRPTGVLEATEAYLEALLART